MSRTANDHETGFQVDAEVKAVLLKAIRECGRGETIGAGELLRELQSGDQPDEIDLLRDVRAAVEQIQTGKGVSNRAARAELRRRFGR